MNWLINKRVKSDIIAKAKVLANKGYQLKNISKELKVGRTFLQKNGVRAPIRSKAFFIPKAKIIEALQNSETYGEAANKLNLTRNILRLYCARHLKINIDETSKVKEKNIKERRERCIKIIKYSFKYGRAKTLEHFNISKREYKTITGNANRHGVYKPNYNHKWTDNELIQLFKSRNIVSSRLIPKSIGINQVSTAIKQISKFKVINTPFNGVSINVFRNVFGLTKSKCKKIPKILTTKKVIKRRNGRIDATKLIPWPVINSLIKDGKIKTDYVTEKYVAIMTLFTKWIHGRNYFKSMQLVASKKIS